MDSTNRWIRLLAAHVCIVQGQHIALRGVISAGLARYLAACHFAVSPPLALISARWAALTLSLTRDGALPRLDARVEHDAHLSERVV